ncbi:V-type ATP synthase subunit E [uncultured Draconibacterium sp.]|uniref:V-type ATP synthase subunit E n=1 Tax=uncultured Draconibacterium sp. TaxID=1573823 RepID=UPI0025EFFAA1|nr:V-type ATP synthase subunit E [uncultured Draconibacterium sp.]
MTDRIEEITQKIYNEGITKAKSDAEQLMADARHKAEEIIAAAQKTHEEIIRDAQKKAQEKKQHTEAELQLAARQFMSHLKQKITHLICTVQADNPVREAFNDTAFIQKLMLTSIEKWHPESAEEMNLKIVLPARLQKELTEFLQLKATDAMDKGLEISMDPKLETGFKIGPKDGTYHISFTAQDFANYFKPYFKDKTKEFLFNGTGNA